MNTKDTLLDILNDIDDSIDWKEQKGLVDERILDSFCVITLISDLEDAIWDMITRLQEKL